MAQQGRLQGKVAIVTGAGSGFGVGIARRFAEEGARVVVADIDEKNGARVAGELKSAFVKADVARSADWAKLVAETTAKHGRLDVVVNNAGWTHRRKPYLEVSEAEFDKVYAVNVKSIYLSAIHALPAFRSQGGGCLVNIASTAGLRPRPGLTVYNSSKGAVILMSKSMAAEFGPDKVRVNCIQPGIVEGERIDRVISAKAKALGVPEEEVRSKMVEGVSMKTTVAPQDIANVALFLATAPGRHISGQAISVCGGTRYLV